MVMYETFNSSLTCLMLTPASISTRRTRSSISGVRTAVSFSSQVHRNPFKCSTHLWTDAAFYDETRRGVHWISCIFSTYYKCTLSAIAHKLNVSGHMLIRTFFLLSVCGTRAQNFSAPLSYTLCSVEYYADEFKTLFGHLSRRRE
jgi:hypothetical protein